MYEQFYKFREKPFTLLPDPGFLYMSNKHRMALTLLEYSLMNHTGFTVISGDIGAGKTTLIRHVLEHMDRDHTVGLISNTHRSFGELLQWILLAFNLDHANMDKVEMYQRFVDFIINEYAHNRSTVLIVDEAQNMPADVLEELRMLSNINADKDQTLQVILVGQRELRETLQRPELAQFAQRISVDFHLQALSENETVAYIQHRLRVAGGDPDIFDVTACQAVYRYSNGVPRLINILCDTSLVYGYAEQKQRIDEKLVTDVAHEKQQGGIFPTFDSATQGTEPATGSTGNDATHPEVTEERTAEHASFTGQVPGYEFTTVAEHHPPEDAVSLDTPSDTDNIHAGQPDPDTHDDTDHEPVEEQPLVDETAYRWKHGHTKKKVRLALCSAHEEFRKYLSRLLESYGIDVVMSVPLDTEHITALEPEKFDVLLIDRDETTAAQSPDLRNILARWRGPLIYNDTQAMKTGLRQGNYEFGKSLADRIEALADSSRTKTGT